MPNTATGTWPRAWNPPTAIKIPALSAPLAGRLSSSLCRFSAKALLQDGLVPASATPREGIKSGGEGSTRIPVIFLARLCKNWNNDRKRDCRRRYLLLTSNMIISPAGGGLAGPLNRLNGSGMCWAGSGKRGSPLSSSGTSTPVRTLHFSFRRPSALKSIRTLLPRGTSRSS